MESAALSSRFGAFLFISSLLLHEARAWQCACIGFLLIMTTGTFLVYSFLHIFMDAACTMKRKLEKVQTEIEQKMQVIRSKDESPPCKLVLEAHAYRIIIWLIHLVAGLKEHESKRVSCVTWHTVGQGISLMGHSLRHSRNNPG